MIGSAGSWNDGSSSATGPCGKVTQQSDLLVNSVGDGIYGVDRDGLVTFVNPAAARALGYRPHELIGRNAHATFHEPASPTAAPSPPTGAT